ncbi:hypothetical protein B0H14DRAFT_2565530 [Mycena olivaceomarginata]|nr:hypothetical protein B0H14DRAFT_2565530 [Mycena olivaceomarginata]
MCLVAVRLFPVCESGIGGAGGDGHGQGTGGDGGVGEGLTLNFTTINQGGIDKLEKWLECPPDMKRKQHETHQLRMEGTGKWFLEHKEYLEWKTNGRTLWVEGPSGTGKSVLR